MVEAPFPVLVDHVGIVVRDLERSIAYYASLGIGPFLSKGLVYTDRVALGKPVPLGAVLQKSVHARTPTIGIQLVQPLAEGTHWKQFLDTRGEGLHHLGFLVDDLEKEKAKLLKQGYRILYESKFQGGGGGIYFDTSRLGMLMEVLQLPRK